MFRWSEKEQYFDESAPIQGVIEGRDAINEILATGIHKGGVMLIGINEFTRFNNLYSYQTGDLILNAIARQLLEDCPKDVMVYRMGGAKFLYVCSSYNEADIIELYHNVKKSIMRVQLAEFSVRVKISGGALIFDYPYEHSDTVYRSLEYALRQSKEDGRGILKFFSRTEWENYVYNLKLREELLRCVENDCEGFEMYFQPIMSGDGKKLYSCEALMRWKSEKFPNVYPDTFIPILEESDLIIHVGGHMGGKAMDYLKEWRKYKPDLKLNINLSYMQIKSKTLFENLTGAITKRGLPLNSVNIEITESCKLEDIDYVAWFVEKLRSKGVEISLDDFGTGYSSVRILQQLTADWIKLDHKFVSKINENPTDKIIVKNLINMCHELGYKICVEGVENENCYNLLFDSNVEALQGYYYSKPIPADEFFEKYIKE